MRSSLWFALPALLVACGDSTEPEPTPDPEGTLVVTLPAATGAIADICYDLAIRDGQGATLFDERWLCLSALTDRQVSATCSAGQGRRVHSVNVRLAGVYLEGEPGFNAANPSRGVLDEVVNPCPNGCTVQVNCSTTNPASAAFSFRVPPPSRRGEIDLAFNPTLPEDTHACFNLVVTNGIGNDSPTVRICTDDESSAAPVSCDASPGKEDNTATLELWSVTPPNGDVEEDGDARALYRMACDADCVRDFTCPANDTVPLSFEPTVVARSLQGEVEVEVALTLTGDEAAEVAGACFELAVQDAEGELMSLHSNVCAPAAEGAVALATTFDCDTLAASMTRDARVVLELTSLYDSDNAPAAAGDAPAASLPSYTNPCPGPEGCVRYFTCNEDSSDDVAFELEATVPAPEAD